MLWLLQHAKSATDTGHDYTSGLVIRAASEFQARHIAQGQAADEDTTGDFWINPEHSTCQPLEPGGVVGIILRDFRAG
jgi:hypothetical protein